MSNEGPLVENSLTEQRGERGESAAKCKFRRANFLDQFRRGLLATNPFSSFDEYNKLKMEIANYGIHKVPLVHDVTARCINRLGGWISFAGSDHFSENSLIADFSSLFESFLSFKFEGRLEEDSLPILKGQKYSISSYRLMSLAKGEGIVVSNFVNEPLYLQNYLTRTYLALKADGPFYLKRPAYWGEDFALFFSKLLKAFVVVYPDGSEAKTREVFKIRETEAYWFAENVFVNPDRSTIENLRSAADSQEKEAFK